MPGLRVDLEVAVGVLDPVGDFAVGGHVGVGGQYLEGGNGFGDGERGCNGNCNFIMRL